MILSSDWNEYYYILRRFYSFIKVYNNNILIFFHFSFEGEKNSQHEDIIDDDEQDNSENQPSTSSHVKNENSITRHNPIIIPDLENNSPNISSNNPTSSSSSAQRSNCPFGSDCNRKNPMHFQSEAHPGDSDYREEPEQNSNLFFMS